ncbi:MAG: tetratricopeptide repeat protein [Acidobacteriota bacterium]
MTPEQWQHVQRILDTVLRAAPEQRDGVVDRLCDGDAALRQEVEALIRSVESTDSLFDRSRIALEPTLVAGEDPRQIGAYELLQCLGHGGMGVVYLARRTDDVHHKQVALKVLRIGFDSEPLVQRFRREREILAQLEHPSIARLLDGGTTEDGRPFLVMEHVEGTPIDRYCAEANLPLQSKLELFEKVCAAVQFAHQNLIVHRDLKPANILVTDAGEPKLLDFGIAKLLGSDSFPLTLLTTAPGQTPMTPAYASPEQMQGGRITTASDIYSLGVLLYKLLTGTGPVDLDRCTPAEVIQRVCSAEPGKPSTVVPRHLGRQLSGDLDNIVLMALRKEPERRYASAEQLAADLERYRGGLPVRARRDTLVYRAGKFVRRHRLAVASVTLAFTLLLAFVGALLTQRREIVEQRNSLEVTSDFLIGLFENPDPTRARGAQLSAREMLDRGAAAIEQELAGQPRAQADLMSTMARSYRALGLLPEAETIYRKALSLRRMSFPPDHPAIAESLQQLAWVLLDAGLLASAEDLAREALALRRAVFPSADPELLDSLHGLGSILRARGHFDEAESLLVEAETMAETLRSSDHARVLASLATLYRKQARYEPAEALYRQAIARSTAELGEDHVRVAELTIELASLLNLAGRFEDSEALYRQAIGIIARVHSGPHPQKVRALGELAQALYAQGRSKEAEDTYLETLEMAEVVYGEAHPNQASYRAKLAAIYDDLGRREEAENLARQALDLRREVLGATHPDTALSCDYLAQVLAGQSRLDEAEALYREAIAIYRQAFDGDHPLLATTLGNYAALRERRGEVEPARELYRQALGILRDAHGADHLQVVKMTFNLAHLLHGDEDHESAREHYRAAERSARQRLRSGHPLLGIVLTHLARLQTDLGEHSQAEASAREAALNLADNFPEGHGRRLTADLVLARALAGQARHEDVIDLLRPQFDDFLATVGRESKKTQRVGERLIDSYLAIDLPGQAATIRRQL